MPLSELPRPGAYAHAWHTIKHLAPDTLVRFAGDFPRPAEDLLREFRAALHRRINARGGLAVPDNDDQLWDWRCDRDAIADYRLRRIVQPGSGLRTALGRRLAPDVHARFRECLHDD